MYTYRFDEGCATQITPAFEAFLYDFALRVAVKSPSVSQNLDTTKRSVKEGHAIRSPPLGKTEDVPRRDMRDSQASRRCRYRQFHGHGRTCLGVAGRRLLRRGYVGKRNLTAPSLGVHMGDPSLRPRIGLFWLIPGMALRGYLII
jgi:hypothetical protein